jgi:hypothetical protein
MEIGNIDNSMLQSQLAGAQLRDKISYAVAAKGLAAARDEGAMVLELLDGAAQMAEATQASSEDLLSNLGQNIDVQA